MTLEEIAKLAGVSRSTVSRVVNEQPNVREDVRQRVLQVIQEHDFHPNTAARALAKNRSQIIGLIIPQAISSVFTDPYFPILAQGIASACEQHEYYLMLSLGMKLDADAYRRMIRAGHLDGVIVASAFFDPSFIQRLLDDRFPFVLIGRQPTLPDVNSVDADNQRGGMMAAQHLARLGYTRIASICGPLTMVAAVDRREGFVAGLRAAGLPLFDGYLVEGDFSEQSGYQAMQRLLALPDAERPQAVFVASDTMALGALRALRGVGLQVPNDIALVGFDDSPPSATTEPPLTTVRQPIEQLGYTAAALLINSLNHPDGSAPTQRIVLPTELVIRESCGQSRLFRAAPSRRGDGDGNHPRRMSNDPSR